MNGEVVAGRANTVPTGRMLEVDRMLFVSYTRVDRDGIGTLLADVRTLGHVVWLDEELSGGQVWWNEILGKIRDCEAFLFMVSPSSVESEACLLELQYATALDRIIIPVHIAETAPGAMPSILESHQTVSYQRGDKTETMALARALAQTEVGRPLPDPLPEEPPLPGSYFGTIRDQIKTRDALSLDQQLGLLHRIRARADDRDRDDVVSLLNSLRARDDLFATVATQIDEFRASLKPLIPTGDGQHGSARVRRRLTLIDRVAVGLVVAAVISTLLALLGDLWEIENNGPTSWGSDSVDLKQWHLLLLVGLFLVLAVLSFSNVLLLRKLAAPAALGVAVIGLLGWWWSGGIVDSLMHEAAIPTNSADIKLGIGMTGSGLALSLLTLAGSMLTVSAYSEEAARVPSRA